MRLINISSIVEKLGKEVCKALPGLHAFTGCDTVSSFSGRGKKKAVQLIAEDTHLCMAMQLLGTSFEISHQLSKEAGLLVCALYERSESDVNEVRYHLFCRAKQLQSHQLPPTKDAFEKHLSRANYVTGIWKCALEPYAKIPNPIGQGWKMSDGHLVIHWIDKLPAPNSIMQLVTSRCKGNCDTR